MNPVFRPAIVSAGLLLAALSAGAATATPASAAASRAVAGGELMRLVSPPAGATLRAGSSLVFEWEPGGALSAVPEAEEWELFVSLDGGRTYLSRLTPHLDLGVRRVTVRVPEVPSGDVRLLVRVGNEEDEEREQVLPGRFRIAAAPFVAPAWRRRLHERGEAARPGAPGVVVWVEGNRDGSGWVEREAEPLCSLVPARMAPGRAGHHGLGLRPRTSTALLRRPLASAARRVVAAPPLAGAVTASATLPSLAQLCRRNE